MTIQIGDIDGVKRFTKFSIEIPIEINFEYLHYIFYESY